MRVCDQRRIEKRNLTMYIIMIILKLIVPGKSGCYKSDTRTVDDTVLILYRCIKCSSYGFDLVSYLYGRI